MRYHPRGLAAIVAAGALVSQSQAADLHVPATHTTLADAIAAASPGDRVILAAGVHLACDVDLIGGITVVGDPAAPASVVIDAAGLGRVMRAEGLDSPVTLDGLTLTGGRAAGDNAYEASGGALLINRAEVQLEHCRLIGNQAESSGGGLRVAYGTVTLLNCDLSGNAATDGGGGMDVSYDATASALASTFDGNTAAWGGGVSVRSTSQLTLDQCRLEENQVSAAPGLGGGVAAYLGASVDLSRTVVADNQAMCGGGIFAATDAATRLTLATLDRNQSATAGGGVYGRDATIDLDHTIISFSTGAAVATVGDPAPSAFACDLHGNSGGDWTGPLAGKEGIDGNLAADPLYCDQQDRNLRADSPCAPEHNSYGQVGALGVLCLEPTDTPDAPRALTARAQPNPFNPRTEIVYALPAAGRARLSIVDVRGRHLATLVDTLLPAGDHRVSWEGRDGQGRTLSSGTYVMVLEAGGQRLTSKLMLLK